MPNTYVYIYLKDGFVPAGLLDVMNTSHGTISHFHYGRRYLQRKDRLAIDPVQLPLHDPDIDRDYITPEGFALFNGIRDASPDGWGRSVLDKLAGSKILTEYDYLVATGDDRIGALAFGPDLSGPQQTFFWPKEKFIKNNFKLEDLMQVAQELDSSNALPPEHYPYLLPGSSLGGARPKATTLIKGKQWIAKFSRKDDRLPICRIEFATMQLAKKAGIHIPSVQLEKVLDQDIYLIERFDRDNLVRIPFVSGLTFTGAHESESSQQSYRSLTEQLRLFGTQFHSDSLELYRRMIFNILCNNTDDHLRNHGFLWDGKGWRVSPAYDIVPTPQVGKERYLALGVGEEGRLATLSNALTQAPSFGLTLMEAKQLISAMQKIVRTHWKPLFKKCGINPSDITRIENCFIACDEKTP